MIRNTLRLISLAAFLSAPVALGQDAPAPAPAQQQAPPPKKKPTAASGPEQVGAGVTRQQQLRNAVSIDSAPTVAGGEPTGGAVQAPVDSTPVVKIEPEVLDLGEMVVDTAKTGKVTITNISDKPVTISKAITSCGCTTAGAPKDPIPPGGSAEVEITLKPGPKPGVPLSKRVTFQIDGHAPMMVTVQGKVPAYITMTPDMLEAPGEGKTAEGAITLKSVDGTTAFKITSVVPPIVPDAAGDAKVEHVVHVDWKAWDETGKTIKLTFTTDHPKVPSLSCLIRRPINPSGDPRGPQGPSAAEKAASALVTAARSGDVEKVKKELEGGANVNAPDSAGGRSALHWAAKEGRVEVIPILLEKGADVNVRDRAGKTALCIAGENGKVEAVKLLLAAKSDVNSTDRMGGTPLMWAAALGSPEAVKALIEAGATVNIADKTGLTPLLWAASTGDPRTVELLIASKADLAAQDNLTGDTALMRAARNGKVESLKALLAANAAIEAKNRQGMTPWLIAAAGGKSDKLQALKAAGADIRAVDARGWNAVDHARNRADGGAKEVEAYLVTELKLAPSGGAQGGK